MQYQILVAVAVVVVVVHLMVKALQVPLKFLHFE
jgi:hypothetical protein